MGERGLFLASSYYEESCLSDCSRPDCEIGNARRRAYGSTLIAHYHDTVICAEGESKKPSVSKLLPCTKCEKKFYTQKGLSDHLGSCIVCTDSGNGSNAEHASTTTREEVRGTSRSPTGHAGPKTSSRNIPGTKPRKERNQRFSPQHVAPPAVIATSATHNANAARGTEISVLPRPRTDPSPVYSSTPANTWKAGKLTGRRLDKNFVCDFCEKRFTSQSALENHARSLHGVECQMTFAFETHETSLATLPPTRRNMIGAVLNDFVCTWCSDATLMSFLSQAALDNHVAQCHSDEGPVNVTPDTTASTSKKALWCQHCARLLNPKQSLSHHIKAVHNDLVEMKYDGRTHTKVVRFAEADVADASACPSTPAYNVLFPDELSPHVTNRSPEENEPVHPSSTNSSHTNQQLVKNDPIACDMCSQISRIWKGPTYHMLRNHGVSVGRKKSKRASTPEEP
ncbi:hypothetical protein TNCV_124021 [Trichonephila clavipes]|nr:hypothetical protein TNCV_124021 [Trichonephila clavipes]